MDKLQEATNVPESHFASEIKAMNPKLNSLATESPSVTNNLSTASCPPSTISNMSYSPFSSAPPHTAMASHLSISRHSPIVNGQSLQQTPVIDSTSEPPSRQRSPSLKIDQDESNKAGFLPKVSSVPQLLGNEDSSVNPPVTEKFTHSLDNISDPFLMHSNQSLEERPILNQENISENRKLTMQSSSDSSLTTGSLPCLENEKVIASLGPVDSLEYEIKLFDNLKMGTPSKDDSTTPPNNETPTEAGNSQTGNETTKKIGISNLHSKRYITPEQQQQQPPSFPSAGFAPNRFAPPGFLNNFNAYAQSAPPTTHATPMLRPIVPYDTGSRLAENALSVNPCSTDCNSVLSSMKYPSQPNYPQNLGIHSQHSSAPSFPQTRPTLQPYGNPGLAPRPPLSMQSTPQNVFPFTHATGPPQVTPQASIPPPPRAMNPQTFNPTPIPQMKPMQSNLANQIAPSTNSFGKPPIGFIRPGMMSPQTGTFHPSTSINNPPQVLNNMTPMSGLSQNSFGTNSTTSLSTPTNFASPTFHSPIPPPPTSMLTQPIQPPPLSASSQQSFTLPPPPKEMNISSDMSSLGPLTPANIVSTSAGVHTFKPHVPESQQIPQRSPAYLDSLTLESSSESLDEQRTESSLIDQNESLPPKMNNEATLQKSFTEPIPDAQPATQSTVLNSSNDSPITSSDSISTVNSSGSSLGDAQISSSLTSSSTEGNQSKSIIDSVNSSSVSYPTALSSSISTISVATCSNVPPKMAITSSPVQSFPPSNPSLGQSISTTMGISNSSNCFSGPLTNASLPMAMTSLKQTNSMGFQAGNPPPPPQTFGSQPSSSAFMYSPTALSSSISPTPLSFGSSPRPVVPPPSNFNPRPSVLSRNFGPHPNSASFGPPPTSMVPTPSSPQTYLPPNSGAPMMHPRFHNLSNQSPVGSQAFGLPPQRGVSAPQSPFIHPPPTSIPPIQNMNTRSPNPSVLSARPNIEASYKSPLTPNASFQTSNPPPPPLSMAPPPKTMGYQTLSSPTMPVVTQPGLQSPVSHSMAQSNRSYNSPSLQNDNRWTGDPLYQKLGGLSVTDHGWNKGWGTAPVDLLQQRIVLPPEGATPPKPLLAMPNIPNCSPDIFRCTLTKVPESQSVLQKSRLPFGILIHPFKDLEHLSVVSCNTIVRCRSCRTYINPFISFKSDRRWECNLCFRINDLPDEFQFDPVSRTFGDPSRRPEVKSATIEFIAPGEYMLRPPQPAAYLYVLEVSRQAIDTGYLQVACDTLLSNLEKIPGDRRTVVGFITFASTLQFYLMDGCGKVQMLEVGDLDDIFIPCPQDLLVNLEECQSSIEDLLTTLPEVHAKTTSTQSALGAALNAAVKLVSPIGGRVTVMAVTLPSIGPGSLKPREDPNQRAAKEISHLGPATDFYKKLALECSGQQVAVDLFTFNSQYIDLATLSGMSKHSGGCIHHFSGFNASSNLASVEHFKSCFSRYITRKIGLEAVMRIRATRGLIISNFHGNFFVRSTDLLSLPNINPDSAFGMQVTIEETLLNMRYACFQAALLYTSSKGERRIRVHTLCLPVSPNVHDIINSGDQEAIVGLIAKMAVEKSLTCQMSDAREAVVNACTDALSAFKISLSSYIGLPAPPNLQLLPLYSLALLKSVALRYGTSTKLDDRIFAMCEIKSLPLKNLMTMIYPDLYAIHTLSEEGAFNIDDAVIPQPARLQLSAEFIDRNGAFLMDVGSVMYVYIRSGVPVEWILQVLDVPSFAAIPQPLFNDPFPVLDNRASELVRNFVGYLQANKPYPSPIFVIREDNPSRSLFIQNLVDDRSESSHSYVEFIQYIKSQMK